MQSFKLKFLGVTILQGVKFPIFLLVFERALQQCSACDMLQTANTNTHDIHKNTVRHHHYPVYLLVANACSQLL